MPISGTTAKRVLLSEPTPPGRAKTPYGVCSQSPSGVRRTREVPGTRKPDRARTGRSASLPPPGGRSLGLSRAAYGPKSLRSPGELS